MRAHHTQAKAPARARPALRALPLALFLAGLPGITLADADDALAGPLDVLADGRRSWLDDPFGLEETVPR